MPAFARHVRTRMLSGLLLLVPLAVTVAVVQAVFGMISGLLSPLLREVLGRLPDEMIPLVSLAVFLVGIYLMGLVTAFVVGRRLLNLGEAIIMRIPLIKSVYALSKQVVDVFSVSKSTNFRSVVVVEFPRPGLKALGFMTGRVRDQAGAEFIKVFIPTAPNPTTGFLELIPAAEVKATDMSVEEAFKMVVSGGVISPDRIAMTSGQPIVPVVEPAQPAPPAG